MLEQPLNPNIICCRGAESLPYMLPDKPARILRNFETNWPIKRKHKAFSTWKATSGTLNRLINRAVLVFLTWFFVVVMNVRPSYFFSLDKFKYLALSDNLTEGWLALFTSQKPNFRGL